MKKMIPLGLALFSVILFVGLIFKNEQHLKQSESIFIHLQPVDPRSLIQGDYMALNYQLNLTDLPKQGNRTYIPMNETVIQNKATILAYVELDAQHRVIKTSFDPRLLEMNPKTTHRIFLKNPTNRLDTLYPASRSFLFAEGLAECYQVAQYAEFKVDQQGHTILASLRGEHLQDLGCEKHKKWWSDDLPMRMHKDQIQ